MSDVPVNQQNQEQAPVKEKTGCMTWIGVLLLLAAILAVVFVYVVKPALEEKGINVQEKIDTAALQSQELLSSAKSKISDAGVGVAAKYDELKAKSEDISKSETVGKIKDTVNGIKDSEIVTQTVEKVKKVGSEVAEKAENGTSWY